MKTFALSTTLVAALTAATAQADDFHHHGGIHFDYHHVDELAARVMRLSAEVTREARPLRYQGQTFRHLYDDAVAMYRLADHIHDIAHHRGNPFHIREDVDKLDRLYHHVEELVAVLRRSYGHTHFGSHGHGFDIHIGHGGWTQHQLQWLQRTMDELGRTLHHLQDATRGYVSHAPVLKSQPVAPSALRRGLGGGRGKVFLRAGNGRIGFTVQLN